ncbi:MULTISPECIES: hypothetical protein [Paenibacillus]|uniref:Glycosyl transferase family 2 n=1 Tax=Paenibacillus albilobatus TaxID=2716884 RepID=A0A919XKS2_9BACL|nr:MULTISPECIES: hypothetical protein [Paenibacillus]MDR9853378.1 hypothetical protein [Paenibacillus sp. VCA1]GIO33203.1 hypothetical protein J2TS6_43440 [Paenibacillus albilobatus]
MLTSLLSILLVYAAAVAAVHAYHAWQKRRDRRHIHYLLITSNHERQIEWYVRALGLYAWVTGIRIQLTVLDLDSDDATLGIVRRLEGLAGIDLSVTTDDSVLSRAGDSDATIIDLRNPHEARQIPYV